MYIKYPLLSGVLYRVQVFSLPNCIPGLSGSNVSKQNM